VPRKPLPENRPESAVARPQLRHSPWSSSLPTLFWALWDEDFGQRPWKTFHTVERPLFTYLKTVPVASSDSQKEVEGNAIPEA